MPGFFAFAAADRLLDELDDLEKLLSRHPYIYKSYAPTLTLSQSYRIAPLSNCILFYTVNEKMQTVSHCHVFYGGRDFEQLLK